MAASVSLNDVARMLSTKGGDISTIGGAIGCISAMISNDARDKENTTSNDVKKIKEFVYGDGRNLSSMIDRLQLAIEEQTVLIQNFIDGNKEKKLVKTDISKMIKSATDGLEKRLDKILTSINMIAKNQGGNIKWGNKKKVKDAVEEFKMSLSDKKKMIDSRIGKLVEMLSELKAVSLKDLITFKPKMKMIDKLNPEIKSLAKNIDSKSVAKVNDFLEKSPKMFKNLNISIRLAMFIRERDLKRFYKILGINEENKPERNTILGLLDSFAHLNKKDLEKANKNVQNVFDMVKQICIGVGLMVVFTPVILAAGVVSKPLEWALFGFKGNGGIMRLLKKLSEKSKTIKDANKSILWMSLGLATLGAGLGLLFKMTRRIEWPQLLRVTATTLVFTGVTVLLGKLKQSIKVGTESMIMLAAGITTIGIGLGVLFGLTRNVDWKQMAIVGTSVLGFGLIAATFGKFTNSIRSGSLAMVFLSAGVLTMGLGLGVLFGLTKDINWEQMAMVGTSIAALGLMTVGIGALNKSGLVLQGAIGMGLMGIALIPFGLALKITMASVKGMKWKEIGMLAAATGVLGAAVIGVGALMTTGIGAIAWTAGLVAIGGLGLALIPFGKGLQMVTKAARGINLKDINNLSEGTKTLFGALAQAATNKDRRRAKKNARAVLSIGKSLNQVAKSLKTFNDVAPSAIDKAIDAIKKITSFFFGKDGMSSYSLDWKKRIKSKKDANTIGTISGIMHKLAKSLKTFNEVGESSITKAKNAINEIATYFFSPKSPLNSMNTSWNSRRKAKKEANAIGVIGSSLSKISKSLKDFNDISENAIKKALDAVGKIATYFFSSSSPLNKMNIDWNKRRKAKKDANAIGVIGSSLYKISKALKDFNEIGDGAVDRMIKTVDKIASYFLAGNKKRVSSGKSWLVQRSMENIADGLNYFDKETKGIDTNRIKENIDSFDTIYKHILESWKTEYKDNAQEINQSMKLLVSSFKDAGRRYSKNVKVTRSLFEQMNKPTFASSDKVLRNASTFVRSVNTVDIEKASSLTDMFKSFASIGKGGNVFSRFDKRVKQFTEACIQLVNAINGNTAALSSNDEEVKVKDVSGEEKTVKRRDAELMPKQMVILNVEDLAGAIADQLNSLNVDCDANINLQINGENGNEWRISRT